MNLPHIFVSQNQISKEKVEIIGSDVNYLKNVMRLETGAEVLVLDGKGKIYATKIKEISNKKIVCNIIETRSPKSDCLPEITIAQALPKAKKMDLIIEKGTELGAFTFIPFQAERSIPNFDKDKAKEKIARWQRIAKEAAEQCGRLTVPHIETIANLESIGNLAKEYDLALIPWELEKEKTLKKVVATLPSKPKKILILIGPEGGFSNQEVSLAKEKGFKSITLGKRILRTETASLALLSMLMYAYD